jgi:hypothetical protein
MFAFTNLGWLLFRETDLHYLLADLALRPWNAAPADWEAAAYFACLVGIYSVPLILHYFFDRPRAPAGAAAAAGAAANGAAGAPLALRTAVAMCLFVAILVLRTANSGDFIYFKF